MKNETNFHHLCQLCSINISPEDIDQSAFDWPEIWKLALRHRVVPVMADRMKKLNIIAPEDIAQKIAQNNHANLLKGMKYAAELIRLTKLFNKHNINFVTFKGIALTKLMGIELHQRHHGDIDILLENTDDILSADKLLREAGYDRKTLPQGLFLTRKQKKFFLNYEKDITYVHPKRKILLELHFRLFLNKRFFPLSVDKLYKHKQMIQIGNESIPAINKFHHDIYLLAHIASSLDQRLKWFVDISLTNKNTYESKDFLILCHKLKLEPLSSQVICLAYEIFNVPTRKKFKGLYNNRPKNRMIYSSTIKRLHGKENSQNDFLKKLVFVTTYIFFYLPFLKKGFKYKKEHFSCYLTRVSDWNVISFPDSLFWLYYALRPLFWAHRQLIKTK